MSTDRPSPSNGPTLARYHLGEALGGGPTGEVFRGKVFGVAGFERQFAVKRFHLTLTADPVRLKALTEAARRYQTIEHPRIARLHEFGHEGDQYFAAVELVPGLDLARLTAISHGQGQPLPPGAALSLLAQLLRAAAYAQGRGVFHLGISPSNVIASVDGDAKLTDFGFLATRLPARPAEEPGLLPRVPYLSPEQLEGQPGSAASDVFQLAAVGVELVTGRRAFGGGAGEVMQAMRTGRAALGGLPEAVLPVFQKALSAAPGARWPTAGAFADALEAALRSRPLQGGRSDVGAAVRRAQQRLSELEAEQLSGAMVFPLPAAPPTSPSLPVAGLPPVPRGSLPRPKPPSFGGEATTSDDTPLPPPGVPTSKPSLPTIELDPSQDLMLATGERGQTLTDPEELIATSVNQRSPSLPLPAGPPSGVRPPDARPSASLPSLPSLSPDLRPASRAPGLPPRKGSKRGLAVLLGLAIAGAGGFFIWQRMSETSEGAPPQPPRPHPLVVARADAGPPPGKADAGPARADAGPTRAVADAGVAPSAPDAGPVAVKTPPAPGGKWRIVSDPSGAQVWLDGENVGKTPYEHEPKPGKHKLAVIMVGYALHRAEIEGSGEHQAKLSRAEMKEGPGAIKVRCATKGRLYIMINGKPSGELCPSERIRTPLGKITVETYDPRTDASRAHDVIVKPGDHGSQRVHLED